MNNIIIEFFTPREVGSLTKTKPFPKTELANLCMVDFLFRITYMFVFLFNTYLQRTQGSISVERKYQLLVQDDDDNLVRSKININFHTKTSQQPTLFISLYLETELLISACYGHHQAPLQNMNIEALLFKKGKAFHFTVA
jgi:hypothetical protein